MSATSVLIVGESGSGKSTSIESLPPKETFVANVTGNDLPYRGWKSSYTEFSAANPGGNLLNTADASKILAAMEYVSTKRPEIKYFIVEDNQYIAADYLMSKAKDTGYTKFTDVALMIYKIATKGKSLRDDLFIFILNHQDITVDSEGEKTIKAKTAGKMIDNQITYEGLFNIVLFTYKKEVKGGIEYGFITNGDPKTTAKSPRGMFETKEIPNDLMKVVEAIKEFQG
jgi:predicted ATPase